MIKMLKSFLKEKICTGKNQKNHVAWGRKEKQNNKYSFLCRSR